MGFMLAACMHQHLPPSKVWAYTSICIAHHQKAAATALVQVMYPVRAAARHAVAEHHRVQLFSLLLRSASVDLAARMHLLGELMLQVVSCDAEVINAL